MSKTETNDQTKHQIDHRDTDGKSHYKLKHFYLHMDERPGRCMRRVLIIN